MKHRLLFFFLFLIISQFTTAQNIYINEFLSSNVTIIADIVDFDDYSDWIELYNDENTDVNIGNWFISDNFDNLTKFQFPSKVIIPSKGYLLLWADGYNEIPEKPYRRDYYPNEYFTTSYYHLNFNLSRAGEEIALFNQDTLLVDSVSFGLQNRDISMGRIPDGSNNWMFLGEPTPDTSNFTVGVSEIIFSNNPVASHESGFYDTPINVELTTTFADSKITYTLDGSRPTSNSDIYFTPIEISSTTVLRIRNFENGKLPSKIVTYSYFINEETDLSVISLTSFPDMLWDTEKGLYENQYKGVEIPISIDFFEPGGIKGFSMNAGLKMSGQLSLTYPQKSVTIYARERYGQDAIDYQIFPDRELNYFKSLYLRNSGVPDNRLTMFRDAALQKIVTNKIDIDAQEYRPAAMYINGEYWGIYNIRDKVTTEFLASMHNINPDDIDLLEYNNSKTPDIMDGRRDEFMTLITYFEDNDLSLQENYNYVESQIDIDEYINYYITEIYFNNTLWLNQNVRFWKERKDRGKWRWILFDTDAAFGAQGFGGSNYELNTLGYAISSMPTNPIPLWSTLTFRKLLDNERFRIKFIQRFSSYLNSIFNPDTIVALIDSIRSDLLNEMPSHINRWRNSGLVNGNYPIQNMSEWEMNINAMRQFAFQRPNYQRGHIISVFNLSGSSQFEISLNDENMGSVLVNNVEMVATTDTNIYFNDVPTILKAIPKVGYRFTRWEGLQSSTNDSLEVILNSDAQITAIFELDNINIIPALISADLNLISDNSPFYIDESVVVDSNITLTINEGVEILVSQGKSITVNGSIKINGTINNPVIIKPNEYSDNWGTLAIVSATDSSSISNLIIEDATHGPNFTRDKAAISIHNSVISIDGLKVKNVQMPVYAQYGRVSIRNSELYTGYSGDLINIKYAEFALVENCDLRGNDEFDTDAIDYDQMEGGIIRGNRIYNFYGFNSDAIDLGENSQNILIENNIIYNINDKGISIGHGSSGIIKRNIIANCGQGVGIKDFNSYGYIEHNTFYGNNYGVASFVKNIGMGGGNAEIVNAIIANSKTSSLFVDELSTINISYSLSNTDMMEGIHNIYDDPMFLNDLKLSLLSPAIDQGNPAIFTDPDGSYPDLGVYYLDSDDQNNLVINEIHYNPIEGEGFEFVEIVNAGIESVNLLNYKITGNVNHIFGSYELMPNEYLVIAKAAANYAGIGNNVIEWRDGFLPNGNGRIVLNDPNGNLVDRVDYENKYWWPDDPNGKGPSLELHDQHLENMVTSSWRSSYLDGGTPGKVNIVTLVDKLYINEFLASNININADENGEFDDWIEIYNGTDNSINIGGLFITDNLGNLDKHQIPFNASEETTISALGKMLLWADGQSGQGILHLDFKLAKEGEQIGLVQISGSDTLIIDSLSYGEQITDVSYGRYPDGSSNWLFFETPSPLDSNVITNIIHDKTLPERFYLSQNYPNPFNPSSKIKYQIPVHDWNDKSFVTLSGSEESLVILKIYNILGQEVATLVNEKQKPGYYEVVWEAGSNSSGIYFYRLKTQIYSETKKMVLLR